MILVDRIRQRRADLSLSVQDVADLVGVRAETVKNWENGKAAPRNDNLERLASSLHTITHYLEGKTDSVSGDAPDGNVCIICGKAVPEGVTKCPQCRWSKRWPETILYSYELANRRKRSHSANLLSLDRDKAEAIFSAATGKGESTYTTTLESCTCKDFQYSLVPCKHIFRLAEELGLFQCEDFAPNEDDYTKHVAFYSAEHDDMPTPEPEKAVSSSGVFWKILKFICCCVCCAVALFLILGALTQGREWVCFPAGFAAAGVISALVARHGGLEGSGLKWGVYGALVPIASWIDIAVRTSQDRGRGFLKGLAYSLAGVAVMFAVFMYCLPAAESCEVSEVETVSGYLGERRILIDPNDDGDEEVSQPEPKSTAKAVNVVVTRKGKKYHLAGCRTVKGKYRVLTVAQARKQGYTPCKVCDPPLR